MNAYVNFRTVKTPVCFGAPYVCTHGEEKCHNCGSRMECAETATQMVHAVASGNIILEGVTNETVQFANNVSNFLQKDFELPLGSTYPPTIALIKYCHGRSKHLITAAKISEPLDAELEGMLRGLDEPHPVPSNAASAISIQLAPQSESELTDEAANEDTSSLEATANISDSAPGCLPVPPAVNQSCVHEIEVTVASKELVTGYPSIPLDLSNLSHDSLVLRSIKLASQFRKDKDYSKCRNEFVAVSLALNQFGLLAPVFRDQPRIPPQKSSWNKYTQLLIDQIVIDCHWLYCRKGSVRPTWPELQLMFDHSCQFDCSEIAAMIAAKNWSCDFRVNELFALGNHQQVELMQLRNGQCKALYKRLVEGERDFGRSSRTKAEISAVRVAINNWADHTHQIRGQEKVYESLWLARELLSPNASYADIAALTALRCGGKPLCPKTVSGKLKQLDSALKRAELPSGRSMGA